MNLVKSSYDQIRLFRSNARDPTTRSSCFCADFTEVMERMGTAGGALMSSLGGSSAYFGPDGRRLTEPFDDKTETII